MGRMAGATVIILLAAGFASTNLTAPADAANSDEYGGPFACVGRDAKGVGTIYNPALPPPFLLDKLPVRHRITISEVGALYFDGTPTNLLQLPDLLSAATALSRSQISIYPSKQTPFYLVVKTVKMANALKFCDFGFVGNEQWAGSEYYSKVDAISSRLTAPSPPAFTKQSDIVFTLDYGPRSTNPRGKHRSSTCRMLFNTVPIDFEEGYRYSTRSLNREIIRVGGVDAAKNLLAKEGPTALPVAVVEAKASLPWYCAAGAVYTAQLSGYPIVNLVVLPD